MKKMSIVIIGPHQAGKSTFIRKLDPSAIRMDYEKGTMSTTVGFDYGIVFWDASTDRLYPKDNVDDLNPLNEIWKVTITGTPGQIAFSYVRKALIRGKDGVIMIIDSAQPVQVVYALGQYQEAKEVLPPGFPFLLLANKQDLPDAKPPDVIRGLLGINAEIVPISALLGQGVREALIQFLRTVRAELLTRSMQVYAETKMEVRA
ncbi:MAG: GTP-binding protein [Candidatus Korarchaeum sp.]|nr:GTP-binding protein [Candidatus Korarchaeum sp.]